MTTVNQGLDLIIIVTVLAAYIAYEVQLLMSLTTTFIHIL